MSSLVFISPNGVFQYDSKKFYTSRLSLEYNMIEFCGNNFNGDTVVRDNVYIGNEDDSIDMMSINIEYLKAVNQVKYSKKRGLAVVNITKYVDKNYDEKNDSLLDSLSSDVYQDINSCAKNMVDTFLNVALFALDNVEIRKETSEPEKESETPMEKDEEEEEKPKSNPLVFRNLVDQILFSSLIRSIEKEKEKPENEETKDIPVETEK